MCLAAGKRKKGGRESWQMSVESDSCIFFSAGGSNVIGQHVYQMKQLSRTENFANSLLTVR